MSRKNKKKSIKKFFQEWNKQLDKQLAIEKLKLATSQIKQSNLDTQLAMEKLKLASSNQNELVQPKLNNDGHHQQATLSNLTTNINQYCDDVVFTANNLEKEMNFKYKITIKITLIKNKFKVTKIINIILKLFIIGFVFHNCH